MLILESQWNSIFPLWLAFSQWQLHTWKNFFPFNCGLSWYACRSAARCWSGLLRSPWALWKSTCQNKRVALSLWDCVSQCCLFLFYSGRATGSFWGSKSRDLLFVCYLREPALCFERSPAACVSPRYAWSRVFLLHFLMHALPMG